MMFSLVGLGFALVTLWGALQVDPDPLRQVVGFVGLRATFVNPNKAIETFKHGNRTHDQLQDGVQNDATVRVVTVSIETESTKNNHVTVENVEANSSIETENIENDNVTAGNLENNAPASPRRITIPVSNKESNPVLMYCIPAGRVLKASMFAMPYLLVIVAGGVTALVWLPRKDLRLESILRRERRVQRRRDRERRAECLEITRAAAALGDSDPSLHGRLDTAVLDYPIWTDPFEASVETDNEAACPVLVKNSSLHEQIDTLTESHPQCSTDYPIVSDVEPQQAHPVLADRQSSAYNQIIDGEVPALPVDYSRYAYERDYAPGYPLMVENRPVYEETNALLEDDHTPPFTIYSESGTSPEAAYPPVIEDLSHYEEIDLYTEGDIDIASDTDTDDASCHQTRCHTNTAVLDCSTWTGPIERTREVACPFLADPNIELYGHLDTAVAGHTHSVQDNRAASLHSQMDTTVLDHTPASFRGSRTPSAYGQADTTVLEISIYITPSFYRQWSTSMSSDETPHAHPLNPRRKRYDAINVSFCRQRPVSASPNDLLHGHPVQACYNEQRKRTVPNYPLHDVPLRLPKKRGGYQDPLSDYNQRLSAMPNYPAHGDSIPLRRNYPVHVSLCHGAISIDIPIEDCPNDGSSQSQQQWAEMLRLLRSLPPLVVHQLMWALLASWRTLSLLEYSTRVSNPEDTPYQAQQEDSPRVSRPKDTPNANGRGKRVRPSQAKRRRLARRRSQAPDNGD